MNLRDRILNRGIQVDHQCAGPPEPSIMKVSAIRTIRKIVGGARTTLRHSPKLPQSVIMMMMQ